MTSRLASTSSSSASSSSSSSASSSGPFSRRGTLGLFTLYVFGLLEDVFVQIFVQVLLAEVVLVEVQVIPFFQRFKPGLVQIFEVFGNVRVVRLVCHRFLSGREFGDGSIDGDTRQPDVFRDCFLGTDGVGPSSERCTGQNPGVFGAVTSAVRGRP